MHVAFAFVGTYTKARGSTCAGTPSDSKLSDGTLYAAAEGLAPPRPSLPASVRMSRCSIGGDDRSWLLGTREEGDNNVGSSVTSYRRVRIATISFVSF